MSYRIAPWLGIALFVAGCAGNRAAAYKDAHSQPLVVSAEQVNTPAAGQQKYFWKESRTGVPEGLSRDIYLDEARLVAFGQEACVAVTLKTIPKWDEASSQLGASCQGEGGKTAATVKSEQVTMLDHSTNGTVERVNVSGPEGTVSVTTPGEIMHRVVVREATFCCPTPAGNTFSLVLESPRMDDSLTFSWAVQQAAAAAR